MRILVDLQACQNGSRQRGIGRYAMAMTRALIRLDRGHDWRILLSDGFPGTIAGVRAALADVVPQEHILVCAMPGRTASAEPANAWRTRAAEIVRARFIADAAPDLLFVPSLFEGFWDATVVAVQPAPYPTAVTLFDFIPLEYPDVYLPNAGIKSAYYRKLADARRADLILPISEFVAREAVARLGVAPERIVTTPLGVEPHFRPASLDASARAALLARYGIDRPFVLNTSPLEYRKNIEGLIAGFARIPRDLRNAHQLVIVGRMNPAAQRTIAGMAKAAGLAGDALVLAGFVPDADLIALYGTCALFAFPSISEGFGLPALEAMACGAPVIGSGTTSIPEVIGRDDLLCDPADPASIGAAMARVLADPALQTDLRTYGVARAAGFTWAAAAGTMMAAFERLHRERRPAPPAVALPVAPPRAQLALVATAAAIAGGTLPLALLAAAGEVTLVCPEGEIDDVPIAATYEVRDFAWFDRHAPRFDPIIYAPDATIAADMAAMMAVYPGILLDTRPTARDWTGGPLPTTLQRDLFAAGGFPLLIAAAGGTIDPAEVARHAGAALRTLAIRTLSPADIADPARLREAVVACAQVARDDPRRALAAALPAAVRDARPGGDDLARLAVAVARNAAHQRAARLYLDITALDSADGDQRALIAVVLAQGGAGIGAIRAEGDRFMLADPAAAAALGLNGLAGEKARVAFRPRDIILGFDRLGSFPPAAFAALREAADVGAAICLSIGGPADPAITAHDALLWARERRPSSCSCVDMLSGPDVAIDANAAAALIAAAPVHFLALSAALGATLRRLAGNAEASRPAGA